MEDKPIQMENTQSEMETYGSGDSYLIKDAVSTEHTEEDTNSSAFSSLLQEIEWCEMLHRGSPGKTWWYGLDLLPFP